MGWGGGGGRSDGVGWVGGVGGGGGRSDGVGGVPGVGWFVGWVGRDMSCCC